MEPRQAGPGPRRVRPWAPASPALGLQWNWKRRPPTVLGPGSRGRHWQREKRGAAPGRRGDSAHWHPGERPSEPRRCPCDCLACSMLSGPASPSAAQRLCSCSLQPEPTSSCHQLHGECHGHWHGLHGLGKVPGTGGAIPTSKGDGRARGPFKLKVQVREVGRPQRSLLKVKTAGHFAVLGPALAVCAVKAQDKTRLQMVLWPWIPVILHLEVVRKRFCFRIRMQLSPRVWGNCSDRRGAIDGERREAMGILWPRVRLQCERCKLSKGRRLWRKCLQRSETESCRCCGTS